MTSQHLVVWRKSSRSVQDSNCVEIATFLGDRIAIRDSKNPNTDVLLFTDTDIAAWITSLKNR